MSFSSYWHAWDQFIRCIAQLFIPYNITVWARFMSYVRTVSNIHFGDAYVPLEIIITEDRELFMCHFCTRLKLWIFRDLFTICIAASRYGHTAWREFSLICEQCYRRDKILQFLLY